MPITGHGWEMHIVRTAEQYRSSENRKRTVGNYRIFHDGVARSGYAMSGMVAETGGPGANTPVNNGLRIEQGRYPLATWGGDEYVTYGYNASDEAVAVPRPALELRSTGERTEILLHPGYDFLASIGCINPCTSLPDASEDITYAGSRRRVITIIQDIKAFVGNGFPATNGLSIQNAFIVIDGEPTL